MNSNPNNRYGALEYLYRRPCGGSGWGGYCRRRTCATTDCPECVTCSGAPLFYQGPCGSQNGPCSGSAPCPGYGPFPPYPGYPAFPGFPTPEETVSANPSAEFIAVSPATVTAGGGFDLRYESGDQNAFQVRPAGIRLTYPGRYFASYNFQNPSGNEVDTTLALELDGAPLNASETRAITDTAATTSSYGGQAIFEADAGDYLSLTSSSAITVPAGGTAPAATLTLVRLGD